MICRHFWRRESDPAAGIGRRRAASSIWRSMRTLIRRFTRKLFSERLNDYFDHCQIIYAKKYEIDLTDMCPYVKKRIPIGYVEAKDVLPLGTPITIRTLEGDVDMVAEEDLIIMVGIKGEVYPNRRERFAKTYEATQKPYHECEDHSKCELLYEPTVHDRSTGEVMKLIDYAKMCIANGGGQIYAKELTERVKVFTAWDEEKYMLGKPGDYLAVRSDDRHDIYVVERDIFFKTYEEKKDEQCEKNF